MSDIWIPLLVMSIALLLSTLGSMRNSTPAPVERPPIRAPYQVGETVCVLHGGKPFDECKGRTPDGVHVAYTIIGIEYTEKATSLTLERRDNAIN